MAAIRKILLCGDSATVFMDFANPDAEVISADPCQRYTAGRRVFRSANRRIAVINGDVPAQSAGIRRDYNSA
jgi:hypothetical protein